jgi:hypothetical protein
MQLRSQRPLHVQGDAGHPGYQGGGQDTRIKRKKLEGREGVEAQGVADQKKRSCIINVFTHEVI